MIRASIFALSLLVATPALAAPSGDGHAHEEPTHVMTEAPTDRVMGSEDAAHTLILYASNVCSHCGSWFAEEWPIVKSEMIETGALRVVFRPMPSEPIQLSQTGFIMAECAPDDAYMDVIEDQFARQSTILDAVRTRNGQVIKTQYDEIAAGAGLMDPASITECLRTESHFKTLQTSVSRATAAGISSIPSFIFDGQVMNGDHDAAAIKGWVEGRSSARR